MNNSRLSNIKNHKYLGVIVIVIIGSVLGPLKCCLYLWPLSAILRYHNIGYHVCADDIQ